MILKLCNPNLNLNSMKKIIYALEVIFSKV